MRLASLAPITLAVLVSAGCGARTGEDELLTMDLTVDGGTSGAGGTSGSGGTSGGGGSSGGGGTSGAGGISSGGAPNGSCCQPSQGRGCAADRSIESCVCAADAFCCNGAWDEKCVSQVDSLGCGMCSGGGSGGQSTGGQSTGGAGGQNTGGESTGGRSTGGNIGVGGGSGGAPPSEDCCVTHSNTGCFDQGVQDCVCGYDPFCCESGWDAFCVNQADQCGAGCSAAGGAGGTGGQGAGGDSDGGAGGANPYCDSFPSDSCEGCACNACYESLIACSNDTGCTCVITSGCTNVMQCLSDDYCGDVLTSGTAVTSVARALQLLSCESSAGCPCF